MQVGPGAVARAAHRRYLFAFFDLLAVGRQQVRTVCKAHPPPLAVVHHDGVAPAPVGPHLHHRAVHDRVEGGPGRRADVQPPVELGARPGGVLPVAEGAGDTPHPVIAQGIAKELMPAQAVQVHLVHLPLARPVQNGAHHCLEVAGAQHRVEDVPVVFVLLAVLVGVAAHLHLLDELEVVNLGKEVPQHPLHVAELEVLVHGAQKGDELEGVVADGVQVETVLVIPRMVPLHVVDLLLQVRLHLGPLEVRAADVHVLRLVAGDEHAGKRPGEHGAAGGHAGPQQHQHPHHQGRQGQDALVGRHKAAHHFCRVAHQTGGPLGVGRALAGLPRRLGVLPLDAPFLELPLDGALLQLRVVPDRRAIEKIDVGLAALPLQPAHRPIRAVLGVAVDKAGGLRRQGLRRELGLVSRLGPHVLALHLPQLGVDLQIQRPASAQRRPAHGAAVAPGPLLSLEVQPGLDLAGPGVKLLAQLGEALILGQVGAGLGELFAQHLGPLFRRLGPLLRGEVQAALFGRLGPLVGVGPLLHSDAPLRRRHFIQLGGHHLVELGVVGELVNEGNDFVPEEQQPLALGAVGDVLQLPGGDAQALGQDAPVPCGLVEHEDEVAVFQDVLDLRRRQQVLHILGQAGGDAAELAETLVNLGGVGRRLRLPQKKMKFVQVQPGGLADGAVVGRAAPHIVLDRQHPRLFEVGG